MREFCAVGCWESGSSQAPVIGERDDGSRQSGECWLAYIDRPRSALGKGKWILGNLWGVQCVWCSG